MSKFTNLLFPSLILIGLVASHPAPGGLSSRDGPWDGCDGHSPRYDCLSDDEATTIVSTYESLFTDFNATLAALFIADGYQQQSDSINFLLSEPPGTITVLSKAAFIQMQEAGPPSPAFTMTTVWHTCDTITFRWTQNSSPVVVQGITVLAISPDTYQIETDYSEFNVGAYLADLGFPECKGRS